MVAGRPRVASLLADDAVLDAGLAAGASVLLGGAILVAWAQVHDLPVGARDLAPVYLGWLLIAGALAGRVMVAVRAGDPIANALPRPYGAAVVAAVVFGATALGDSVYVTAAGFGRGLEALLSPFHVLEILCGGVLASTPLRAALGRQQATGTIPVLVSAGLLMAVLSFFTQFASPASDLWASRPPAAPASVTWWAAQDLGAAGILLHATLLVSVSLFLVRHFRLRRGSLTLVAGIGAVFALSLKNHWELLPALIAPGIAADLALWWLAPTLGAAGAARRMGAVVPGVFTIAYWANLSVSDGTWWSVQLWIGLVITAGVLGWLAGYLVVPAGAGEELSAPSRWVDALAAAGGPVGADDVKWALERLDDRRGLAASPLARLPAVATPPADAPDALRTLLTELVRDLAAASDPRDAEAGRVLHSAYVRRAGPHETVAEALHLSRPTYFRRLQRGLQLLAARVEEHSTFVARAS